MNEITMALGEWIGGLDALAWLSLIEIVVLSTAVVAVFICCRMAAAMRVSQRRIDKTLSLVEGDLRLISMGYSATDDRVGYLEKTSDGIRAAQVQLESRASGPANYGQAVNLVRKGWQIDDLISNCGLSRGEAELVYLLHGPGGALKAPHTAKHEKVRPV